MMHALGPEGMSSDEEDDRPVGRQPSSAYAIAQKPWRSAQLIQFLHQLDQFRLIQQTERRGQPFRTRRRSGRVSTSTPTRRGLWRNIYNGQQVGRMLNEWEVRRLQIQPMNYDFSFPPWFYA